MLKRNADHIGLGVKLIALGLFLACFVLPWLLKPEGVTAKEIENARLWLYVEEFKAIDAYRRGRLDRDIYEVIRRGSSILQLRARSGDVETIREIQRLEKQQRETYWRKGT